MIDATGTYTYTFDTNFFISLALHQNEILISMIEYVKKTGGLVVYQYVLDELARHTTNTKAFPKDIHRHYIKNVKEIIENNPIKVFLL